MDSARGVSRLWPGETFVCAASGPSMRAEDLAYVRGRARVIVVNTTYQLAPWADVLYAADQRWWTWHQGCPDFQGLKFSMGSKLPEKRVFSVYKTYRDIVTLSHGGKRGLSDDPRALCTGDNSGYQAINLAVLLGAARILLLGYDMQRTKHGPTHWHPPHPAKTRSDLFASFRMYFETMVVTLQAKGIEVLNCSRQTALTCFPRVALEDALPLPLEAAS